MTVLHLPAAAIAVRKIVGAMIVMPAIEALVIVALVIEALVIVALVIVALVIVALVIVALVIAARVIAARVIVDPVIVDHSVMPIERVQIVCRRFRPLLADHAAALLALVDRAAVAADPLAPPAVRWPARPGVLKVPTHSMSESPASNTSWTRS